MSALERIYDGALPELGDLFRLFGGPVDRCGSPTKIYEIISVNQCDGWCVALDATNDPVAVHATAIKGPRPWLVPIDVPYRARLIEPNEWAALYMVDEPDELEDGDLPELEAGEW